MIYKPIPGSPKIWITGVMIMIYEDETSADALEAWHESRMDADLEMAGWAAEARAFEAARKAGKCTHGSWVGLPASGEIFYEEQKGLTGAQVRCNGCKVIFANDEAITADTQRAVYGS